MKALVEYIKEGKTVNEKKIASIQDEIAFWNNPKTEKELIKITGLNKDFVHDAVMYIAGAVEDTLKDGYSDDWSIVTAIIGII